MDQIFDRIGNLLKSLLQEDERSHTAGQASGDPDIQAAWDELDDYLRTGGPASTDSESARPTSDHPSVPEELRQDYANLEVPFGAPMNEVVRSYRRLLRQYHPDKHANNPERLATATEIAKKINLSYQRIRKAADPPNQ